MLSAMVMGKHIEVSPQRYFIHTNKSLPNRPERQKASMSLVGPIISVTSKKPFTITNRDLIGTANTRRFCSSREDILPRTGY